MKKQLILLIAILVSFFLVFLFLQTKSRKKPAFNSLNENECRFGNVSVNKTKKIIEFPARVVKNSGYVNFLVYARGYKWLEKSCAITGDINLPDLQNAIAFLDWKLWDRLWVGNGIPKDKDDSKGFMRVFINYDNKDKEAISFIDAGGETFELGDFVFLGSPFFDPVILRDKPGLDCGKCPAHKLEEKSLRKEFIRNSGKSGYELNENTMPPVGMEVTIKIKWEAP